MNRRDVLGGLASAAVFPAAKHRSGSDAVSIVSPEMFGGMGDGQSDDTASVIAAVHVLRTTNGGTLKLTAAYITNNDIVVPADCIVEGGGSVLVRSGQWKLNSRCRLSGVKIADTQRTGFVPIVKVEFNSNHVVIENCYISGGTCIWINSSSDTVVKNNHITSSLGYPIFCDGINNGEISGNTIRMSGGYGIEMSGYVINNKIINNEVEGDGVTRTGIIFLSKHFGRVCGNRVARNTIRNVSEEGISIDFNSRFVYGETSDEWRATNKVFSCSMQEETGSQDFADRTLVILGGPQAGGYCSISHGTGGTNAGFEVKDATFTSLEPRTRIGVGWAPYGNVISNNKVDGAGRNGIMLYGSQVGSIVRNNEISNCGDGTGPVWNAHVPYRTGGIAALTISQLDHDSPLNGCQIVDNCIRHCPLGLQVGIARWDGLALIKPVGMKVERNLYEDCEANEIIE